ncbi:diguanylate cyclase (GGDEF)-like protein/hemerythrin-like metal-binding protein [Marinobacter nauticus]|uniref:Diguanylate cyclase (GGDEF)-like protein/hemerythrin-like metal-binding protein n=1 Tax=Marinobacter nauticus TaxID=2743 RepID=A0A368XKJ0_MARNT|nr:bacteriohemerythrin [Marinobacter nauticus]RCW68375.1 diguanylate cyclase (GGDEF)-like protein/hemerythrin-like metal-binding protein [Marinobacter nauticus]
MTNNVPSEFEIFPWNRNFETGIDDIDQQHKVLVNILNRLAWHFASDTSELTSDQILDELLSYAAFHFKFEEAIWNKALSEDEMARNHHDAHQMFFVQVEELRNSREPQEEVLTRLFDFLTRWLAFHILESDRRMALTVELVQQGLGLSEARNRVDSELSGSASVLVNALLEIYGKLSSSTIQLMREKMARLRAEDELSRIQHERLHQALEEQALEYQQHLETLAYTDALTGLWNRNGIVRRVREYLGEEVRPENSAALVSIDLDNFKDLNDCLGEDAADRLLGLLSRRWLDAIPADACLARTGGDEFALLLPDANHAESRLEALRLTARQPFELDGVEVSAGFTAGVVLFPDGAVEDADILLRQADNTLYRAKHEMRSGWLYLDAGERSQYRARQLLLEDIRRGLNQDEFRLYYQPKVNLRTGEVLGLEALIRWQHPRKGLLSPIHFLPAIEHHTLNIQVGEWVLRESLRQLQCWDEQGANLNVSVNIAANHLQSDNFTGSLSQILAGFPDVDPARLDLEILETAALGELDKAVKMINDCRQLGVTFSLDDFGTGYSSLSYLKRLPVNTLKVDREFVSGIEDNSENLSILQGVIGLSRVFGKQVVAEGVETVRQGEILLSLGCECAQGFAMSPPIEATRIPAWVTNWQTFPEWALTRASENP